MVVYVEVARPVRALQHGLLPAVERRHDVLPQSTTSALSAALVYVAVNTKARRLSAAAAALTTHSRALLHSFGLEQRRTAQLDLISLATRCGH